MNHSPLVSWAARLRTFLSLIDTGAVCAVTSTVRGPSSSKPMARIRSVHWPGSILASPLPIEIEHAEPGGVSWTTRKVSPAL